MYRTEIPVCMKKWPNSLRKRRDMIVQNFETFLNVVNKSFRMIEIFRKHVQSASWCVPTFSTYTRYTVFLRACGADVAIKDSGIFVYLHSDHHLLWNR